MEKEVVYLTISDLANKLQISKGTIHDMRRKRLLPKPVKVCGSIRWIASEVDQHLSEYARIDY